MARRKSRRRFGMVRKCYPSGRYQASYLDPEGVRRRAPHTFETIAEAGDWLTMKEAELLRGEWVDPDRGRVPLDEYGTAWISERPGLSPRTVDLYTWLFAKYVRPRLGSAMLVDIDAARVRRWRHQLLANDVSPTMVAKAYRLLRAIMMTAVDDELVQRNPCRIRGAGNERTPERPVLTLSQVLALADEVPERLRVAILIAAFASLRFGELAALQRRDVDVDCGTIRVRQAYTEVRGKGVVLGPPKSQAGVRTIALPAAILPDVQEHLERYVGPADNALVFTGPHGATLRRGNFNKLVKWRETVARIGVPGLHFHDLRHTGNTLAAATGVSTRDLMARMGHDSINAALIYQHATSEAGRAIAAGLDAAMRQERAVRRRPNRARGDGGEEGPQTPETGT